MKFDAGTRPFASFDALSFSQQEGEREEYVYVYTYLHV